MFDQSDSPKTTKSVIAQSTGVCGKHRGGRMHRSSKFSAVYLVALEQSTGPRLHELASPAQLLQTRHDYISDSAHTGQSPCRHTLCLQTMCTVFARVQTKPPKHKRVFDCLLICSWLQNSLIVKGSARRLWTTGLLHKSTHRWQLGLCVLLPTPLFLCARFLHFCICF